MQVNSTNKVGANNHEIEFTFDASEFETAVNSVYNRQKNNITIHGFRKGKAPRKMIETQYGDNVFYEEAVNTLYRTHIEKIIEETKLDVIDIEASEVLSLDKNDGVKFKVTAVTKPEIEISDYKGISLKKTVKTITDADVDAEIKKVQEKNARIVTVEGRAAELGDTAVIDFEGFADDVAFDGGKGTDYSLELGSGTFIPGFEEQVVGKNVGDEFDVNVTFPEHYHADNLAGKPVVFKCKLHEIKGKELTPVDDEFVKDVSEFDTLEEYRADVKKKLEEEAEKSSDIVFNNELTDAIVSKMKAEIPAVLYERRTDEIVREWAQSNRIEINDYLKYTGESMDNFRKNFSEAAKRQVDLRLALEQIAKQENIEVSAEELDKEYDELSTRFGVELDRVKAAIPADAVSEDVKMEKAIQFVKDSAVIEEVSE